MAQDERATPEVFFYRVTCTAEVSMSPARHPGAVCLLLLPSELTEITQDTRTEPGRWYRFRSLERPRRVPMTPDQAEGFRGEGWRVEDPRPARGKPEHALVAHRRKRLAEEEDLARRIAELRGIEAASLKAQEKERVDQLWLARLFRKLFADLSPMPWWEVLSDYDERWCEARGVNYHLRGGFCTWTPLESGEKPDGIYSPEFDSIRSIVLGWVDGLDKAALAEAVGLWREKLHPVLQQLKRVTNFWRPGQPLLNYLTEELPRVRPELDELIESLPDSPPAMVKLLSGYKPIAAVLASLEELRTTDEFTTIAVRDEHLALRRLCQRGEKLAALLDNAERNLADAGWTEEGGVLTMKTGKPGGIPEYKGRVICGLYAYLWPIYRRTFDDPTDNPRQLRGQISQLLSPYFAEAEISPASKGSIDRFISNFIQRNPRARALKAEALEHPAASQLSPIPVGRSLLSKGDF